MPAGEMVSTTDLESFKSGDEQHALDAATQSVRDYCGWHVGPSVSEVLTVKGRGLVTVFLPSLHVTDVASVTVDGTLLEPDEYTWTPVGLLTRVNGPCFALGARIDVELTHGHDPVPSSVAEVVMARATRRLGDAGGNIAQVSKGPFSTQYNTGGVAGFDPKTERDALDPYRIPRSR